MSQNFDRTVDRILKGAVDAEIRRRVAALTDEHVANIGALLDDARYFPSTIRAALLRALGVAARGEGPVCSHGVSLGVRCMACYPDEGENV